MLKFARFLLPDPDGDVVAADRLVRMELDLLQVDVDLRAVLEPPVEWWEESAPVLKQLHKALFVRPELAVVTNVGTGGVLQAVESLAHFLVRQGSPDMPVSAIRGENLLPCLDSTIPATAIPEGRSIRRAYVEVGGGPIATALAEGGRIVVAGAYDVTAPLLAAAVLRGWCTWQDHRQLAEAATAAQLIGVVVEMWPDATVGVEAAAAGQLSRIRALGSEFHADVDCDYSSVALEHTVTGMWLRLNSGYSARSDGWNVRIYSDDGALAVALIAGGIHRVEALLATRPHVLRQRPVRCTQFRTDTRTSEIAASLVRIEYKHEDLAKCQQFLKWLQLAVLRDPEVGEVVAPKPSTGQLTKVHHVRIPAEHVAISVDTRPAREWL